MGLVGKWSLWCFFYMYIVCLQNGFYTPDLSGRIIMVWRWRLFVHLSACLFGRLSVGLFAKLVNTIETELFHIGPSNLVHLLLLTRGQTLLIFKIRGLRSRSHAGHCY